MMLINREGIIKHKIFLDVLDYLEIDGKIIKDRNLVKESEITTISSKEFLDISKTINELTRGSKFGSNIAELNKIIRKYRYMCIRVVN